MRGPKKLMAMHPKMIMPIRGGMIIFLRRAGMTIEGRNPYDLIFIPLRRAMANPPKVPKMTTIIQAEN